MPHAWSHEILPWLGLNCRTTLFGKGLSDTRIGVGRERSKLPELSVVVECREPVNTKGTETSRRWLGRRSSIAAAAATVQ